MAKIGTAHVEIKPVLNEEELERICATIEEAVSAAIRRSMKVTYDPPARITSVSVTGATLNGLCTCPLIYGPHPSHQGSPPVSST